MQTFSQAPKTPPGSLPAAAAPLEGPRPGPVSPGFDETIAARVIPPGVEQLTLPSRTACAPARAADRPVLKAAPSSSLQKTLQLFKKGYQREWHSIIASVASSAIGVWAVRSALSIDKVASVFKALPDWIGGTATMLGVMAVWYVAFTFGANPLLKKARSLLSTTQETANQSEAALGSGRRHIALEAEKAFIAYSMAVNVVQFAAQIYMLRKGIDPKTATLLNSLVGNVYWLSTLPVARYLCQRYGEETLPASKVSGSKS